MNSKLVGFYQVNGFLFTPGPIQIALDSFSLFGLVWLEHIIMIAGHFLRHFCDPVTTFQLLNKLKVFPQGLGQAAKVKRLLKDHLQIWLFSFSSSSCKVLDRHQSWSLYAQTGVKCSYHLASVLPTKKWFFRLFKKKLNHLAWGCSERGGIIAETDGHNIWNNASFPTTYNISHWYIYKKRTFPLYEAISRPTVLTKQFKLQNYDRNAEEIPAGVMGSTPAVCDFWKGTLWRKLAWCFCSEQLSNWALSLSQYTLLSVWQ